MSRQEAAQLGAAMLEQDQFHYVVTPNPEFILAAEKDADFRQVLNSADLVIPDGIGVVYSAKICLLYTSRFGLPSPHRAGTTGQP